MTDTKFQEVLRCRLEEELPSRANALISAYGSTLDYLTSNIYEEIRASEPDLTDHGPNHIANVQSNVLDLLEDQGEPLSAAELYCLAMCILFHDAGNIHKRLGHQHNIGAIFDAARGTNPADRREKTIVIRACGAHTGTASDGSGDTLRELAEVEQFDRKPVRLRELAAILRFADELAEGPQRTSSYRLQKGDYSDESTVYHEYASITHVLIDRGNRRILLAYEIQVASPKDEVEREKSLKLLLSKVFQRIDKLDQERRYAVHYSPSLSPFKATVASFTFHCGDQLLDFNLPQIRLDDFMIPGIVENSIDDRDPTYSPENLARKLIAECKEAENPN